MKKPIRMPSFGYTLLCLVIPFAVPAMAQDMYDTDTLRTFHLRFHDANWNQLMRQNWQQDEQNGTETLILADLDVEGKTYPSVGVRIRGNSSYFYLPPGSDKFSIKIKTDHVDPDQQVMGYDNFNLNNGFQDPTFIREIVFNNYAAQLVPNARANHVQVQINGQNWGVYNNIQQGNKRMLRDYFENADGMRATCSNNPQGPGLAYLGSNPASYSDYEINNDGGMENALGHVIELSRILTQDPVSDWSIIDQVFAVDPAIWTIALENLLTDDDGYVNKGCDFMLYRNPIDSRTHLLPRDNNETLKFPSWSTTRNFNHQRRPVLTRLLGVPELRQRYFAHYRTLLRDFGWETFGPLIQAQHAHIDSAVQADPKKIYTYPMFQNNVENTVTLSGFPPEQVIGLRQFFDRRATTLAADAELNAAGPTISGAALNVDAPSPDDTLIFTADVTGNGTAVEKVDLFYRPDPTQPFRRVEMRDDGKAPDEIAGDNIFTVSPVINASPGLKVHWYAAATAGNTYRSMTFEPARAELAPNVFEYGLNGGPGMRLTEWMYSGGSGEFIEFTNTSDQPIDLTGWSMDDSGATAGAFDLSAFGVVEPGESVIVTESVAADFRAAWGLPEEIKIIGELGVTSGNNLGRNDQIHLYNAKSQLEDRLAYGDQTYAGSIRTQNRSGQTLCKSLGIDDVMSWLLASIDDEFGSFAASSGDVGTPGFYTNCGGDPPKDDTLFRNGFENAGG